LIDSLSVIPDFNRDDIRSIESRPTPDAKNTLLLKLLIEKRDSVERFVEHLIRLDQPHAAALLNGRTVSDKVPMSDLHLEMLNEKSHRLAKFLNPVGGLLNELVQCGVFQERDVHRVRSKPILDEMANEVVTILLRKWDNAFQRFISALNATQQEHVAFLLTGHGEPPLADYHINLLRLKRKMLVDNLITTASPLVSCLIAKNVFSINDGQWIRAETSHNARNECFLDILLRKSRSAFDKFIEALIETDQEHIVKELQNKTVIGYVETECEEQLSDEEKKLAEERIVEAINEGNLFHKSLESNGLLMYASKGSIAVHFICMTEESVNVLEQQYNENQRIPILTESFCHVFQQEGMLICQVRIEHSEFERCRNSFKSSTLMTLRNRSALKYAAANLLGKIHVSDELLRDLTLNASLKQHIAGQHGEEHRASVLLDIVSRRPDHCFTDIMNALEKTNQAEVARVIKRNASQTGESADAAARVKFPQQLDDRFVNSEWNFRHSSCTILTPDSEARSSKTKQRRIIKSWSGFPANKRCIDHRKYSLDHGDKTGKPTSQ
jgi:Caspase recruitment domain